LHAAWGDAGLSWRWVWDRLALSFTVIAPDLPGFGESSPLPRPSLWSFSHVLKQLLDLLNVDRVIVVGNSFGASVAIQVADDFPDTVSTLVLVNGGYTPPLPPIVRQVISLPLMKQCFGKLMQQISFSPGALNRAFADPSKLPPGFLETILKHSSKHVRISRDTWLNQIAPMSRPSTPTTVLWGRQDRLAPAKYAQKLQTWLPGADIIMIEGAGHMPQMEKPDDFLAAILSVQNSVPLNEEDTGRS
jgi:pimeloyl-ACP methyl ester carboxylesterase